ncbi:MAG: citrate transporter [Chloroflexi bacterium]|nr:citrate transporter [Chloroflexota bacterium]
MQELAQVSATLIFLATLAFIIAGKVHRYIPALIGGALVLAVLITVSRNPAVAFDVLNLRQLVELRFWFPGDERMQSHGVNWQTIVFIGGMMLMVEGLAEAGLFRWMCLLTARLVRYRVAPIFIAFMVLSGFLAMFIDSITVLLFMASVTVELSRALKFDPAPMIIAEIFAANTGGSATMSGDPPNMVVGSALGFTFGDFAVNTGPIAWAGMLLSVVFFYLAFRKVLTSEAEKTGVAAICRPCEAIPNPRLFAINGAVFFVVIALLVTHAATGASVAMIGVVAAALTLLAAGNRAGSLIRRLDWRTLLFFVGLFVSVAGLEETGVIKKMAGYVGEVSGGNILIVLPIVLWFSAFASALVDNIPLAAAMTPIMGELAAAQGLNLPALAWALSLGTDIGGNATPIGASANVVGIAVAEREGHPIGWGKFVKYALPAMILVVGLSWVMLVARYT